MVDKERVLRMLELRSEQPDSVALDAIKYRFITVIEGAAKVAHHLSVSGGWATPETNADAFVELGRQEVIDSQLSSLLSRAVGFRNVLVHQYDEIDDTQVVATLDRLSDQDGFVRHVGTWIADE